MPKNTKIVVTLWPATESVDKLHVLISAWMNVVRLNFSHWDYSSMLRMINNVRQVSKEVGISIPLIQDLQWPKIRVWLLPSEWIELVEWVIHSFVGGNDYDGKNIPIPVQEVIREIAVWDFLLLDDWYLKLEVVGLKDNWFDAKVLYGWKLTSKKGIIAENKTFSLSALTKKDFSDLDWGYENKIWFEFIAFSFVKSAEDVRQLRAYIKDKHGDETTKIIVKFETALAVKNMESIVAEADVIMVARWDLGLEVPIHYLPAIQKQLVTLCRKYKKTVIVATQMLSSMMEHPIPNRSEVADIANAIYDKSDAIMLSNETSVWKNAIPSVQMMTNIIHETEKIQMEKRQHDHIFLQTHKSKDEMTELAKSVFYIAESIDVKNIVVLSKRWYFPSVYSSLRSFIPITVVTASTLVEAQLRLSWWINEVIISNEVDESKILKLVRDKYNYREWDKIIICSFLDNVDNTKEITKMDVVKF